MDVLTHDLLGLGTGFIVAFLILREVFSFLKNRPQSSTQDPADLFSQRDPEGFSPQDRLILRTIETQVDQMHTKLEVNKELQKALAAIMDSQTTQTNILNRVTELQAQSLSLLEKLMQPEKN